MVRYWFSWAPAAIAVGAVILLSSQYLALIALLGILVAAIVGVAALVWAMVSAVVRLPRRLMQGRAGSRGESATTPRELGTSQGSVGEPGRARATA